MRACQASGNCLIGVLGGTFNPVHNGHLFIAKFCLKHLHLDKILFIPSAKPPHKNREIAEFQHRYNMLKLALSNSPKFEISDLEHKRRELSYSVITLQELHKIYSKAEIFFIIGEDNVEELPTWYNYRDLFKLANLVVVSRKVDKSKWHDLDYSDELNFLEMPLIDISSTKIRDKIRKGEDVSHLLPKMVYEYIKENKLYI